MLTMMWKNYGGKIMTRGISFRIPNEYGIFIKKIVECVDINKFYWYNIEPEDQVFSASGDGNEFLFDEKIYVGEDFNKIISSGNYYTISIKLQAYLSKNNMVEIRRYEEFVKSNCEMILFITDNIFVDFYIKDKDVISDARRMAMDNKFDNIEVITENNDKFL